MNEDMVEAGFDWISEQSQVHNRGTLTVLEAWSHIKAWSEKIASIRGNTVPFHSESTTFEPVLLNNSIVISLILDPIAPPRREEH